MPQVFAGALVGAAHQVNLRKGVEDRAGRLVELDRAPHLEASRQDVFGALEVAELDEDLAERGERHRKAMARGQRLVQRDASLGKRERLLVLMPHQRDVRLVVHDAREHVVTLDGHGEAFTLRQRRGRFLAAPGLCEQHRRQRMDEREMPAVAGRVQRRGRFGQVFADDSGVADLLVTERELVVREADEARVVRELGMLQRAGVQRDGARLFAACIRDAPVQPPQRGELRVADRFAQGVRWAAERRGGLRQVVLEQPCFGKPRANGKLVLARERSRTEHRREQLSCFRATSPFERSLRPRQHGMNSDRRQWQEYTQYTGCSLTILSLRRVKFRANCRVWRAFRHFCLGGECGPLCGLHGQATGSRRAPAPSPARQTNTARQAPGCRTAPAW